MYIHIHTHSLACSFPCFSFLAWAQADLQMALCKLTGSHTVHQDAWGLDERHRERACRADGGSEEVQDLPHTATVQLGHARQVPSCVQPSWLSLAPP